MLPVYGALHFIPMILFKRRLFMKNPTEMLLKAGWGTARSSTFLGLFVFIYQSKFFLIIISLVLRLPRVRFL